MPGSAARLDTTETAREVAAPVVVVIRERSNGFRLDVGVRTATSVQNGSLVSVPGSALLPWLLAGEVPTVLKGFLNR